MRNNLIKARQNKKLTQVELADKLKISTRQYQKLEAGTSDGSIKTWCKLKDILDAKTIDYLLEQAIDNTNPSKE